MSTIKVNSIEPANAGSEDYFLARAWVSLDGTGTVSIRDSGNVSSITDNATGDYTANFSTALSGPNYSYSHAYSNEVSVQHAVGFLRSILSSALSVKHYNAANSTNVVDKGFVLLAMFE